jgi:DNA polymerase
MVRGEGPLNAKIMLVGEAPGREENEAGRPFVGAAGRALERHLYRIGLKREDVYITNVVKCRPPANRTPTREEMLKCIEHLHREIVSVKPKVVVAMGRISIQALSGIKGSMSEVHGKTSDIVIAVKDGVTSIPHEFKLFLTFHPAAELYSPAWRNLMDEDFEKLKLLVEEKKVVELPCNITEEKKLTEKKVNLDKDDPNKYPPGTCPVDNTPSTPSQSTQTNSDAAQRKGEDDK